MSDATMKVVAAVAAALAIIAVVWAVGYFRRHGDDDIWREWR